MSHNLCCNDPSFIDYKITHDPKPLPLSEEMTECLERLLWYVPNINSVQSPKHVLIESQLYDDFTFSYIMQGIGMSASDVLWERKEIDKNIVSFFENKICTNCQKLILKQGDKETRTTSMLRHIRNAIAHGYFAVCNDMLIGFDSNKIACTGIIKIRPKVLLSALKMLDSGITKEALIAHAFSKVGYQVIREPRYRTGNRVLIPDIFITKDDRQYLIEIKVAKYRSMSDEIVRQLLKQQSDMLLDDSTKLVLMIDNSLLTDDARKVLRDSNVIILDMKNIENLLLGIDVLSDA